MRSVIKSRHRQQGLTIWGWVVVIALIAFFAKLTLGIYPMVFNHFKVQSHLQSIAKDPAAATMSKAEIVDALRKRFDVDNVEFIDLVKDVKLEEKPKEKKRIIRIEYEVRAEFLGNYYMLGDFRDTYVEIPTD